MIDTFNVVIDLIALVCIGFIVVVLIISAWDLYTITKVGGSVVPEHPAISIATIIIAVMLGVLLCIVLTMVILDFGIGKDVALTATIRR